MRDAGDRGGAVTPLWRCWGARLGPGVLILLVIGCADPLAKRRRGAERRFQSRVTELANDLEQFLHRIERSGAAEDVDLGRRETVHAFFRRIASHEWYGGKEGAGWSTVVLLVDRDEQLHIVLPPENRWCGPNGCLARLGELARNPPASAVVRPVGDGLWIERGAPLGAFVLVLARPLSIFDVLPRSPGSSGDTAAAEWITSVLHDRRRLLTNAIDVHLDSLAGTEDAGALPSGRRWAPYLGRRYVTHYEPLELPKGILLGGRARGGNVGLSLALGQPAAGRYLVPWRYLRLGLAVLLLVLAGLVARWLGRRAPRRLAAAEAAGAPEEGPISPQECAVHRLPFPLAALYYRVLVREHQPRAHVEMILRFAEASVRFLVHVALADAIAAGVARDRTSGWLRQLESPASFGTLVGILRSVRDVLAACEDRVVQELPGSLDRAWRRAVGRLVEWRNDLYHGRKKGLEDAAAEEWLKELRPLLDELVRGLQFLRRYHLGTAHGTEPTKAGLSMSRWRGSRGQVEERREVRVYGHTALPEGLVLLLDPESGAGLVLGPFLHRILRREPAPVVVLERLLDGGKRCHYVHSVTDLQETLPAPAPPDATSRELPDEGYLAAPDLWHRRLDRALDTRSRQALGRADVPGIFAEEYRQIGILGEGGMAVVWEVEDIHLQRRRALKILKPSAELDKALARFSREAKLLDDLEHPGIVKFYRYGLAGDEGTPFIVMELVKGEPLSEYVRRCRRRRPPAEPAVPLEEAVGLLCHVLEALAAVHAAGVIHRDIKPSNIMMSVTGPRLIDFGIAGVVGGTTITDAGEMMGTVAYMAPEQMRENGEVTLRSDIYAAGRVLYQVLVGASPPMAGRGIAAAGVAVPPAIEAVYERATAQDPEDRFACALEMAEALQGVPQGGR